MGMQGLVRVGEADRIGSSQDAWRLEAAWKHHELDVCPYVDDVERQRRPARLHRTFSGDAPLAFFLAAIQVSRIVAHILSLHPEFLSLALTQQLFMFVNIYICSSFFFSIFRFSTWIIQELYIGVLKVMKMHVDLILIEWAPTHVNDHSDFDFNRSVPNWTNKNSKQTGINNFFIYNFILKL